MYHISPSPYIPFLPSPSIEAHKKKKRRRRSNLPKKGYIAAMADSTLNRRNESQNEGQAQAIRLDEAVLSGKGCEPQNNPQKGMGQGDTMKDLLGNAIPKKDAAKKVIGSNIVNTAGGNGAGDTYQYSDRSLI